MAMKEEIEGYMVAAFVAVTAYRSPKQAHSEARTVSNLIKRHVAAHADIESAIDIEPQVRRTCEHCGRLWTESDLTFNGGCCAEDAKNDPELAEQQQ